jgi:hypothetical protein
MGRSAYFLVLTMLMVAGILAASVRDEVNSPVPPQGLDAHETHAAASLLGQFRTSASSWLWLRTDLYLHNGVEMRPLSDEEKAAGHKGVGGHDDGHEAIMNDDAIVTVVPAERDDFRGVLGDIEREISAYKDMKEHAHRDPKQALPLFRLMTWMDPQFVTAWVTGATVIARDTSEMGTAKAIAFLDEAETHNPNSCAVPTEKARLLISRRKDIRSAKHLLEIAMKRGLKDPARLEEIEKSGLNLAARLLALVYRDSGQVELLKEHLRSARTVFKDDLMLKRLAENLIMSQLPVERPAVPNQHAH